jgi:hypothetical protein
MFAQRPNPIVCNDYIDQHLKSEVLNALDNSMCKQIMIIIFIIIRKVYITTHWPKKCLISSVLEPTLACIIFIINIILDVMYMY